MAVAQAIRLLALSLLILTLVRAEKPARYRSRGRAFIELQCQKTLYPTLCVTCLSPYAANLTKTLSHRQLAQTALKVTLAKAESTRAYITGVAHKFNRTKGLEGRAVMECLDQINDGVDQLTNCIKEAQHIKEEGGSSSEFRWHASNVQTWMSTALTDATMCMDGFSGRAIGGKTKAMIKAKVLNLQQVTSIALALFNRFAARFRASHAMKP